MNKRVAVALIVFLMLSILMTVGFAGANVTLSTTDMAQAYVPTSYVQGQVTDIMLTGSGSVSTYDTGFVKFSIPATPSGEYIVSATLMADVTDSLGTGSVSVFLVTSAWSSSTLSGTNLPTTASTATATKAISGNAVYSWTVTSDVVSGKAANGWEFVDTATGTHESLDDMSLVIVYNLIPVPENGVGICLALVAGFAALYFMKKPKINFKRN